MKSEEGKLFLEGGPLFHIDAPDKESPGYLGFTLAVIICLVLIENCLTKKK